MIKKSTESGFASQKNSAQAKRGSLFCGAVPDGSALFMY